ncbi:hypothetical protein RUND412_003283 [Rhizina undulata]
MTVTTTPTKDYHVIRETTDILYDYADKETRGRYRTLEEASEAVRGDLKEYEAKLEDYEETVSGDGGVRVVAVMGDVEFQVTIMHRPPLPVLPPSERHVFVVTKTEKSAKKVEMRVVGVYRSDDVANEVAERELRRAAGIGNWMERRRFKGVYREGYNLEGLFEGAVVVRRRVGEEGAEVEVGVEEREVL